MNKSNKWNDFENENELTQHSRNEIHADAGVICYNLPQIWFRKFGVEILFLYNIGTYRMREYSSFNLNKIIGLSLNALWVLTHNCYILFIIPQ